MTFPKIRNIEDLIKKSNKILFRSFSVFYLNLGKMCVFENCILGPRKCSSRSKYFI